MTYCFDLKVCLSSYVVVPKIVAQKELAMERGVLHSLTLWLPDTKLSFDR